MGNRAIFQKNERDIFFQLLEFSMKEFHASWVLIARLSTTCWLIHGHGLCGLSGEARIHHSYGLYALGDARITKLATGVRSLIWPNSNFPLGGQFLTLFTTSPLQLTQVGANRSRHYL